MPVLFSKKRAANTIIMKELSQHQTAHTSKIREDVVDRRERAKARKVMKVSLCLCKEEAQRRKHTSYLGGSVACSQYAHAGRVHLTEVVEREHVT